MGNDWMDGFVITHYVIVMETDPLFANDKKVKANGLEGEYREGFLFKEKTGVLFQGTGQTEAGEFITINWRQMPRPALLEWPWWWHWQGQGVARPRERTPPRMQRLP